MKGDFSMWKKIVPISLCMALVVGCGGKDDAQVKVISKAAGDGSQQASERKSETAIYLSGGVGLDFGRAPIIDKVIEDKSSKIRILGYEFSESHEAIDKSIASILEGSGYVRKINSPGSNALSVTYLKQGAKPVLARYALSAREGFDKKTVLTLSWRF
jgi:hypothetical protein